MRILLIDDSAAYQDEFTEVLRDGPFAAATVDCAGNARDGMAAMKRGEHDIFFIDYRMPGDDGLALVEQARAAGLDGPIIFLTGFDSPQVDQAAERAGANDYLTKGGFTPEMLSRSIRYALRNAADVRAAREAESRFRLAQDAANIGTWDWNLRTRLMVWSPRQRAMFGLDPADNAPVTEKSWRAAIHPDDRDAATATVTRCIADGETFETLFRLMPSHAADMSGDAAIRWLAGKGMVTRDATGAATRVLGVHVDVTEQQNAMADLRASRNAAVADLDASEKRFRAYFESAADWLIHVRVGEDGNFVTEAINPAARAHTALATSAARGLPTEAVFGAKIGGAIATGLRAARAGGVPISQELSFATSAGTLIFDVLYLPLRDHAGEISGMLCAARDISDRRRLEESLRHAQKMEILGQIASGVSHDFNNILQSISGCLELVIADAPAGTSAHDFLALGLRAAHRGSELTHHLLAYARKQMLRPHDIALPALLKDLEMLLAPTIGAGVALRIAVDPALARVHADPAQLQTALLNLALNAAQAMPDGGVLSISARELTADDTPCVVISVTDTGTGMDAATLARAAEPFFTTKGAAGTGLGLSMVQGFVTQSGGRFDIRSRIGHGTTVDLYLPRATAASRADPEPPSRPAPAGVNVLLVDDDPDVLTTVGAFLEKAGFAVARARNGHDALGILSGAAPIDAIISDFGMPGMNGADLILRAHAIRPGLPAILISGYTELAKAKSLEATVVTLRKPFPRQVLIDTLARLLATEVVAAAVP